MLQIHVHSVRKSRSNWIHYIETHVLICYTYEIKRVIYVRVTCVRVILRQSPLLKSSITWIRPSAIPEHFQASTLLETKTSDLTPEIFCQIRVKCEGSAAFQWQRRNLISSGKYVGRQLNNRVTCVEICVHFCQLEPMMTIHSRGN